MTIKTNIKNFNFGKSTNLTSKLGNIQSKKV